MKKRDLGLILGMFFVLMSVYFPITAFVFNGGFASAIGIEAFCINAGVAIIITLVIFYLVSEKSETEDKDDDAEDGEECEIETENDQPKEEQTEKH